MDKRRSVAILATLGALPLLAASLGSLDAGCSNDGGSGNSGADAAAGDAGPARSPPNDQGGPSTPSDCRAACEAAHPTAVAGDRAINECWHASCADACLAPDAGGAADAGDAGPDADGGANQTDAGTCGHPVETGSAACDRCTGASCCAAWDGCFADPECTSLEACYQSCS